MWERATRWFDGLMAHQPCCSSDALDTCTRVLAYAKISTPVFLLGLFHSIPYYSIPFSFTWFLLFFLARRRRLWRRQERCCRKLLLAFLSFVRSLVLFLSFGFCRDSASHSHSLTHTHTRVLACIRFLSATFVLGSHFHFWLFLDFLVCVRACHPKLAKLSLSLLKHRVPKYRALEQRKENAKEKMLQLSLISCLM